jgi:hypothetical protein
MIDPIQHPRSSFVEHSLGQVRREGTFLEQLIQQPMNQLCGFREWIPGMRRERCECIRRRGNQFRHQQAPQANPRW